MKNRTKQVFSVIVIRQFDRQITSLILTLAMISGIFPHYPTITTLAQTSTTATCKTDLAGAQKKISAVVHAALTTTQPTAWVDPIKNIVQVLVQTSNEVGAKSVGTAIAAVGGLPVYSFRSIDGVLAVIPRNQVVEIARLCEVERITADHATQQTASHLETTTGLSKLRSFSSTSNTFSGVDGTGVGIAILDSGVMKTHTSLANSASLSRVTKAVNMLVVQPSVSAASTTKILGIDLTAISSLNKVTKMLSKTVSDAIIASTEPNPDDYGHGTAVAGDRKSVV